MLGGGGGSSTSRVRWRHTREKGEKQGSGAFGNKIETTYCSIFFNSFFFIFFLAVFDVVFFCCLLYCRYMERTVGPPHSSGDRVAVRAVVAIDDPVENG